jgi:hypothetical protein
MMSPPMLHLGQLQDAVAVDVGDRQQRQGRPCPVATQAGNWSNGVPTST